jgi:hypothetical protein
MKDNLVHGSVMAVFNRDGLHQHTYTTIRSYRPALFFRGTQEPRQEHVKHFLDAFFYNTMGY